MKELSNSDLVLITKIKELKSIHPFWGYRRIWAHVRFKENLIVNKKKIYRLMKINNLLIEKNKLLRACRTPQRDKPCPTRVNEWWGIDMTKIRANHLGWVYITIVIDWYSKKIVGYSVESKSKTSDWLSALNMAVNNQFPNGIKDELQKRSYSLNLMADNGCQPSSDNFVQSCKALGINLVFTSYNNPKGNADTERFMRTMKEECLWLNEWDNLENVTESLICWFGEYNQNYLHSTLQYKSPNDFELEFLKNSAENQEKILLEKY